MRYLKFVMVNNQNLEGEQLFRGIYSTLMLNKEFINFGFQKIIILSVILANNQEHNLHCNILINNDTTFEQYYDLISQDLNKYNNLQYGYHDEEIVTFVMLSWNVDNEKNINIKQTYNAVNGLKPKFNKLNVNNPHSIRTFTTTSVINKSFTLLNNNILNKIMIVY
jgi:hypothetical protein